MTVQHILVPTDFSADADRALEYAITLAGTLHARVTLLHVLSTLYWGTGDVPGALPATFLDELEAVTQQSMAQILQRVRHAGIEGETLVEYGSRMRASLPWLKSTTLTLLSWDRMDGPVCNTYSWAVLPNG